MPAHVSILRAADGTDCTNKGITSRATHAILIGEHEDPPKQAHGKPLPVLRLVRRWVGTSREYCHAEPLTVPKGMVGPCFGGNYITTGGNSAHNLKLPPYPIPVHDRFDTPEDWEILSR